MVDEGQEIRISFKYKQEDFNKAFTSNYYTNKMNIFTLLCLIPIILGAIIVYIIFNDPGQGLVYEEYMLLILACGLILVGLLRPYSFIKKLEHRWNTSYQFNKSEIFVVINNDGFYIKTIFGEQRYNWIYIYRIIEQKEAFCFYFNSQEYRVIPKRVLEAEQVIILRDIVIVNCGLKYTVQGFNKKKILESKISK